MKNVKIKVLDSFQNDKSPGIDGFTEEFYKFFYDLLENDLLACLNEVYEKHELTISQRRGINTLLPKEDGSLLDLSTGDLSNKQQIPGILVALDFRKTFNSLEWPFIKGTLNSFNFSTGIKQWISTFYTNIESSRVIYNGYSTSWFRLLKGLTQGCPLSQHVYILFMLHDLC